MSVREDVKLLLAKDDNEKTCRKNARKNRLSL